MDFLINTPQKMRVNGALSDAILSPWTHHRGVSCPHFCLSLYTNECHSVFKNRDIIKFVNDSVIVSLLNNDSPSYGPIVDEFSDLRKCSFLDINAIKNQGDDHRLLKEAFSNSTCVHSWPGYWGSSKVQIINFF